MRRKEEKNKVGRPKLADNELKKKSYIMLGVALLLTICLTFGGLFSLTNVRLGNLKGAAKEKPANPVFKDINFYKCVIDAYNKENKTNISYRTNLDNNKLKKITDIDCHGKKVFSAKGTEKLPNLANLDLSNNMEINEIDLSRNTKLVALRLGSSKLKSIDLSNNPELASLDLNILNLKNIDLRKNPHIVYILIYAPLKSIDLTRNIELKRLNLNLNNLTDLDLSKNINLQSLDLGYTKLKTINLHNNTNLTHISLYSNHYLKALDLSKNKKLEWLTFNDYFLPVRIIKGTKVKSPIIVSNEALKLKQIYKYFNKSIATYKDGYWTGIKTGKEESEIVGGPIMFTMKVFDLASDKYKIDKQNKYVYVEDDTDKEVLNNIKVSSNASKRVEKGYFYVMDKEDKVVVEKYKIVRVVSKNYKLLTSKDKTKKYIYTKSNGFNKNNIKLENCTLQQNGKESITIKYGNTILGEYRILNVCNALLAKNGSYKVSCEEDDAKINKVYQYISDAEKTLSAKEGKISVEESNSDRGAVVKVDYTYKGKKYTDESNLITIPRSASFKHETEETYCKVYITGVNNSKALYSVRCDANAKPSKIEVYEGDTKLALLDKNYKEHYGLFEDNRSVEFSKYKMQNGKTYTIRIAYNFVDNGKIKYDYYRTSFKIGENKKEDVPSIAQDDTQKCAIKIIKVSKGSLKYSLACNKNARPNSIRITTKYNNRPLSKISKKVMVNHTSTYLNGKTQNLKEELSVINNFGTKAQNVGALSYGMKEEGVITNLDKGEYRLLFYYAIKDNAGKVITNYVRTYSNAMNVN